MQQTTTKDKLSRSKFITDNKAVMLFKDLIRPILSLIASSRVPYKVIIERPCHLLPDRQDHFVCANYRSNTGSCSSHFIRAVVLEKMVWMHMEAVISYVSRHGACFRKQMEQRLLLQSQEAVRASRKKLAQDEKRIAGPDRHFGGAFSLFYFAFCAV